MENESSFAVGEDGFIDLGTLSNINEDEIRINSIQSALDLAKEIREFKNKLDLLNEKENENTSNKKEEFKLDFVLSSSLKIKSNKENENEESYEDDQEKSNIFQQGLLTLLSSHTSKADKVDHLCLPNGLLAIDEVKKENIEELFKKEELENSPPMLISSLLKNEKSNDISDVIPPSTNNSTTFDPSKLTFSTLLNEELIKAIESVRNEYK